MTQSGTHVASFILAVDRAVAKGKEREADFIPIVAWRNHAEFVSKYIRKGERIGITGKIQIRNYEGKDGKRVYVTEVIADNIYFADGKSNKSNENPQCNVFGSPAQDSETDGFFEIDECDELPF
jgi:single-strand DNA-binding protein